MSILKRHWNKLILGLFASFWTGCADKPADNPPSLYGCPPDICAPNNIDQESPNDKKDTTESSPSTEEGSSSENAAVVPVEDEAEKHFPAPIYGAPAFYEDD